MKYEAFLVLLLNLIKINAQDEVVYEVTNQNLSSIAEFAMNCVKAVPCPFKHIGDVKVQFRLYTRLNRNKEFLIKFGDHNRNVLEKTHFDPSKPTKVLVHGFLNGHESPINEKLKESYLKNHDVNVVVSSWGSGSKTLCYNWAVQRVELVGKMIGEFLNFLMDDDEYAWERLTIVGHSLGAHVAGFAGKAVQKGKVGTIIGLDPGLR